MQPLSITVVGAGITGLWQALTLARRGHRVRLVERSAEPFARGGQRLCRGDAGALLRGRGGRAGRARSGSQVAGDLARDLSGRGGERHAGRRRHARPRRPRALRAHDGGLRHSSMPSSSMRWSRAWKGASPPASTTRRRRTWRRPRPWPFSSTRQSARASRWRSARLGRGGAAGDETVIDCRGLGARDELPDLRGVRGERIVVRTREVSLAAPRAAPASAPSALCRAVGRRPASWSAPA